MLCIACLCVLWSPLTLYCNACEPALPSSWSLVLCDGLSADHGVCQWWRQCKHSQGRQLVAKQLAIWRLE